MRVQASSPALMTVIAGTVDVAVWRRGRTLTACFITFTLAFAKTPNCHSLIKSLPCRLCSILPLFSSPHSCWLVHQCTATNTRSWKIWTCLRPGPCRSLRHPTNQGHNEHKASQVLDHFAPCIHALHNSYPDEPARKAEIDSISGQLTDGFTEFHARLDKIKEYSSELGLAALLGCDAKQASHYGYVGKDRKCWMWLFCIFCLFDCTTLAVSLLRMDGILSSISETNAPSPALIYNANEKNNEEKEGEWMYNPARILLSWDGKPIPYWLYKLHGL